MRLRHAVPGSRGFTLVELMVALSGGLFLSMMVFALARDTSRFYQRENRLAGAVLAGMAGFERLKSDIARAGYLTTPNIERDPKVCTRPTTGWPTELRNMASLRIKPDFPALTGIDALNVPAPTPDEIVLAGSYGVTDRFPIESVVGKVITLQAARPALARVGYRTSGQTTEEQDKIITSVFPPGRVLRIIDDAGLQYFGVIESVDGGPPPTITLTATLEAAGGTKGCGVNGYLKGRYINVVNFVRYQIRNLKADDVTRFRPLFAQSEGAPGEDTRTELVREELKTDGTPFEEDADLTTELVSEYAVDLGFSVTAELPSSNTLVHVQPSNTEIFGSTLAASAPQRVRAVRVRLSVRSREADRETAIANGLYRFKLSDGGWARVRTFQADVALQNQLDVRWQ